MRERLAQLPESIGLVDNPFANVARAEALRRATPPTEPDRLVAYRITLGQELLFAGRTEEAIREFSELSALSELLTAPPGVQRVVAEHLALAHLRLGFVSSCPLGREVDCPVSCSRPTEVGAGENGRGVIERYERLLEGHPEDLTTRWLLNIAYRNAGLYPRGVPANLAMPAPASEHDILTFHNIAPCLDVHVSGHAGGVVLDDLDGDGDLDIMASSRGLLDQIRLFRNEGDGTFHEGTREAGLEGLVGGLNLVQADYDNDGDVDVFVLRGGWFSVGHPNSLLRNNGDGSFEDATEEAGVFSVHPTQTAAWGDFDNDGWLDLYIGNETRSGSRPHQVHASELYRNNGDGTFTDVATEAGVAVTAFVKSVVWGDYDNDGRLDLYVSCFEGLNYLFRGEGPGPNGTWGFRDVTDEAGVAEPLSSFPAWFWDYDNDGWLDLLVFGFRLGTSDPLADLLGLDQPGTWPRLYRNNGDGTFTDQASAVGLARSVYAMGANFGDLDNDGFLDLYAGTGEPDLRAMLPNRAFRNHEGRAFQDVTTSGGFGELGKGHGVAFGDIDQDGDQDIYTVIGGALEGDLGRNALYLNPGHGGAWVTLRLRGVRANRSAIGARIRVRARTPAGTRDIHVTVGSGGSFGASSLQQEIGLGRATGIERLEIRWPGSGRVDLFADPPIRQVLEIHEGAEAPVGVTAPRIDLPR